MLAFSLPVIIWKMWLTNDCSFTVLFISKARAFLVLLQRNPLAAAVSFVQCWRSALFPELPHPWSETLEGNLWFKQLIFGLFFFSFLPLYLLYGLSCLSEWGKGLNSFQLNGLQYGVHKLSPFPHRDPVVDFRSRAPSKHISSPPMLLPGEKQTNKKPKNLPTKQACVFYLPWLKFHQYNGSVSKLRVFLQGGTNMLHLFLWHHDVI